MRFCSLSIALLVAALLAASFVPRAHAKSGAGDRSGGSSDGDAAAATAATSGGAGGAAAHSASTKPASRARATRLATSAAAARAATPADCFRGYEIGTEYEYTWLHRVHQRKVAVEREEKHELAKQFVYQFRATVQPLSVDDAGQMHFSVAFAAASFRDVTVSDSGVRYGMKELGEEHGVDFEGYFGDEAQSKLDGELLRALNKHPFYFTQSCTMRVTNVHYPKSENLEVLKFKSGLVNSLSHNILAAPSASEAHADARAEESSQKATAYVVNEEDHIGDRYVRYTKERVHKKDADWHTVSGGELLNEDGSTVHVYHSHHDSDRTSANVRNHLGAHVDKIELQFTDKMKRRSVFAGGVPRKLTVTDEFHFPPLERPGKPKQRFVRAEMHYDKHGDEIPHPPEPSAAQKAQMEASVSDYEHHSRVLSEVALHAVRRRRAPRGAAGGGAKRDERRPVPPRVRNSLHFLRAAVGDAEEREFRSEAPHMAKQKETDTARAAHEAAGDAQVPYVMRQQRFADTANELLDADGAPDVPRLVHALSDDRQGVIAWAVLRQALHEHPRALLAQMYAYVQDDSPLSDQAIQDILTAVAEVGRADEQRFLLRVLRDDALAERTLVAALFAVARVDTPSQALLEAVEAHVTLGGELSAAGKQAALVLGVVANHYQHKGDVQRAHEWREVLYDHFKYQPHFEGNMVLMTALSNSLKNCGDLDTAPAMRNVTHGLPPFYRAKHAAHLRKRSAEDDADGGIKRRARATAAAAATSDAARGNARYALDARGEHVRQPHALDKLGRRKRWHDAFQNNDNEEGEELGEKGNGGFLKECDGEYNYVGSNESVSCGSLSYLANAPPEGTALYFWDYKIGKPKFYGQLRFDFDWFLRHENLLDFEMRFFAGGGVFAHVLSFSVEIAAGYGKVEARVDQERAECATFEAGLYYSYIGHVYYWGIKLAQRCRQVETTCSPNSMPDEMLNRYLWKRFTFFEQSFPIPCPIPLVVDIGVFGDLGVYYALELLQAPEAGGLALFGYVGPFAALIVTGGVSVGFDIGIAKAKIGLEIQITIIEVRLPLTVGFNLLTRDICMYIGIRIGALGGAFVLKIEIKLLFVKKKWTIVIFKWKGVVVELEILSRDCCILCKVPCASNGWCNFRYGGCECDDGWGGPGCEIECPKDCVDMDIINPRAICIDTDHLYTDDCECYYGYMGWNCQDECPGMPSVDYRGHPCWDNGNCLDTGKCACFYDYFDVDCNKTCDITGPVPAHLEGFSDGERCHENGICMFRYGDAQCGCFKGYDGEQCEISCDPLVHGMPCAFRGLCYKENPDDTTGRCQCEFGFHGERCEVLDYSGSGRAIRFDGGGEAFCEASGQWETPKKSYSTAFWMKPESFQLVNGTNQQPIVWRWGDFQLNGDGALHLCSKAEGDCIFLATLALNNWYFVCANVNSYTVAHDVNWWVYRGAPSAPMSAPVRIAKDHRHQNVPWLRVPSKARIGVNYIGVLDHLSIFNALPTDEQVEYWMLNIVHPKERDLMLYFRMDEGVGRVLYDDHQMFSCLGTQNGTDWVYVDSEVHVNRGQIWSNSNLNVVPGVLITGDEDVLLPYAMYFDGRLWFETGAKFVFSFDVDAGRVCEVVIELNGHLLFSDFLNGQDYAEVNFDTDLASTKLDILRSVGTQNILTFKANGGCQYAILEHALVLSVPASEGVAESSRGAYWESAKMLGTPPAVNAPYTFHAWVKRDEDLFSHSGILAAVVEKSFDPRQDAFFDTPYWKIYEAGGTIASLEGMNDNFHKGVQAHHTDGKASMYNYYAPVGDWFHLSVSVNSNCVVTLFIDGKPALDDEGLEASYDATDSGTSCGGILGGGNANYELILMPGFLGALNNVGIKSGLMSGTELLASIHQWRDPISGWSDWTWFFTFDDTDVGPTVSVTDNSKQRGSSGGDLVLDIGIFRGILLSNQPSWKGCPGIHWRTPEATCATDIDYSRGRCVKLDPYSMVMTCDCLEGFLGMDCRDECPGAVEKNVCNGHGVCFSPNQGNVTGECQCDVGWVGEYCDLMCPGWDADWNFPPKICAGRGACVVNGSSAECVCDYECNCYGAACQFLHGTLPVAVVGACEDCDGSHEVCKDDACVCESGFYRVFSSCVEAKINGAQRVVPAPLAVPWLVLLALVATLLRRYD